MSAVTRTRSGSLQLVDDAGAVVTIACDFIIYLESLNYSPNTVFSYLYDLLAFWRFLRAVGKDWHDVKRADAAAFLLFLRSPTTDRVALSGTSTNRMIAAVSTFYDWAVFTERFSHASPFRKVATEKWRGAADGYVPFLSGITRARGNKQVLRVKVIKRLPRPLSDDQIERLTAVVRSRRDIAIMRLLLDGGLRPGEVLGLHLEDINWGRRNIVVRPRENGPPRSRAKGGRERVVDLQESRTLASVRDYILADRPHDTSCPTLFLVGGRGHRRCEPLSYAALVKWFARASDRAKIRNSQVTPHALRHTHATRMWEGGMRELSLMKRLGHASPASTAIYTKVSDAIVTAEYSTAMGLGEGVVRDV